MSTYRNPKPVTINRSQPLPYDANEVSRREQLAENPTLQAGIAAAQQQELSNRRGELSGAFADLQRMRSSQGNLKAACDGYLRVYKRIEYLAGVIASVTGEGVEVPEFDPPQILTTKTRIIGPPKVAAQVVTRDDGTVVTVDPSTSYRESGGKGPSGRGTAGPAIPGSAADHGWLEREGGK